MERVRRLAESHVSLPGHVQSELQGRGTVTVTAAAAVDRDPGELNSDAMMYPAIQTPSRS